MLESIRFHTRMSYRMSFFGWSRKTLEIQEIRGWVVKTATQKVMVADVIVEYGFSKDFKKKCVRTQ